MRKGKGWIGILVGGFIVFGALSFIMINRANASKINEITMDSNPDELMLENVSDINTMEEALSTSTGATHTVEKDETVYVNLNTDGTVSSMNIVNHFKTREAGVYQDFGSYESIINLTDSSSPGLADNTVFWEFTEPSMDFYYQGKLKEGELPWTFDIQYYLNQEEISGDMLAGSEGELLLRLNIKENSKAEEYFRKNYMLQLTIPINLQNSTIISAPGAVQMVTGRTNTLAYTILAQTSNQFEIKLNVKDFTMEGIDIAIMKADVSSYMETENITTGFEAMSEGMAELESGSLQLKEGMNQLSEGINELSQGLSQLSEGTSPLKEGMEEFDLGMETFTDNMEDLSAGSQQIKDGLQEIAPNGALLFSGYQDLEAGIDSIVEMEPQLRELAGLMLLSPDPNTRSIGQTMLEQLEGLKQLQEGIETLNAKLQLYTNGITLLSSEYDSFHLGVSSLPEGVKQMKNGFQKLQGGNEALYSAINQISSGAEEINTVTAVLPSQVQLLADGQGEMKEGVDLAIEQIQAITNANNKIQQPVSFVAPGKISPNSVQFILRTPAIKKKQDSVEAAEPEQDKRNFWDQLIELFR